MSVSCQQQTSPAGRSRTRLHSELFPYSSAPVCYRFEKILDRSSLVVADATNLVPDLREKHDLPDRGIGARAGPQVGDLVDRALGRGPHDLLAESKAFHIFEVFEPRSQAGRMRCLNAVRGVGAEHIKTRSLKPPSPLLKMSSAFVLSAFTAATAFSSM